MTRLDLSLYLVLDPLLCLPIGMVETARRAVAGGATMVQLRDKHANRQTLVETGRALKQALDGSGAALVVNDDIHVAMAIGADGVHVGQDDMALSLVRQRVGAGMIVGVSAETAELARGVDASAADYIGAGPVFPTATKPGHKPAIGFDGLAGIVRATRLPVVAIGGLNAGHCASVIATGAGGLAVVSAICGQPDPQEAAGNLARNIAKALR